MTGGSRGAAAGGTVPAKRVEVKSCVLIQTASLTHTRQATYACRLQAQNGRRFDDRVLCLRLDGSLRVPWLHDAFRVRASRATHHDPCADGSPFLRSHER